MERVWANEKIAEFVKAAQEGQWDGDRSMVYHYNEDGTKVVRVERGKLEPWGFSTRILWAVTMTSTLLEPQYRAFVMARNRLIQQNTSTTENPEGAPSIEIGHPNYMKFKAACTDLELTEVPVKIHAVKAEDVQALMGMDEELKQKGRQLPPFLLRYLTWIVE